MANPFLVLGGIAVGIVTATFGVLSVPGWVASAQDAAAINDLSAIRAVQATTVSETSKYAVDALDLFTGKHGVELTSSGGVELASIRTFDDDWCGVVRSASGAYWAVGNTVTEAAPGLAEAAAVAASGCSIEGSMQATVDARCVVGKVNLTFNTTNGDPMAGMAKINSPYDASSSAFAIAAGAAIAKAQQTRAASIPAQDASVTITYDDGRTYSALVTIPARTCA